jgi:hypothetical protein
MDHLSGQLRQLSGHYFSLRGLGRSVKRSVRQGLASTSGWESRQRVLRVP